MKNIIAICIFLATSLFSVLTLLAQPMRPLVVTIDTEVPETHEWAERMAAIAKVQYPFLVAALDSEGYEPVDSVIILVRYGYGGSAAALGQRIFFFFEHDSPLTLPDTNIVVHELVHVLQAYPKEVIETNRWIFEGIASYIELFMYARNGGQTCFTFDTAKYTDGYQNTATFFDWIVRTKDAGFIKRINAACRNGTYSNDLFWEYMGITVDELWDDFIQSFKKEKNGVEVITTKVNQSGKVNNSPLYYIVDGKEGIDINSISPGTIETITVLKDQSTIEQYGEKGKNGVVIITTKKE